MVYVDASVSLTRLDDFFGLKTKDHRESVQLGDAKASIVLKNASFVWEDHQETSDARDIFGSTSNPILALDNNKNRAVSKSRHILQNISLKVGAHELVAVIGSVGSGKSSLLSGILGDLNIVSGLCEVTGSIAYCSQTPWIQNMTLRDNILFGLNYSDSAVTSRYDAVIYSSALEPDLKILPNGDNTEIGEKGINLSGGTSHFIVYKPYVVFITVVTSIFY
jgi:ATP-binding cassette subfamily C (CFTR/MRP) protein 1